MPDPQNEKVRPPSERDEDQAKIEKEVLHPLETSGDPTLRQLAHELLSSSHSSELTGWTSDVLTFSFPVQGRHWPITAIRTEEKEDLVGIEAVIFKAQIPPEFVEALLADSPRHTVDDIGQYILNDMNNALLRSQHPDADAIIIHL